MIRSRTRFSVTKTMEEKVEEKGEEVWEVRPGGMLVQKRDPDTEPVVIPIPTIRVKVKYESAYYEIYVSSQATFGELKKLLGERTGLHPQDQKIVYKERERESREYLDTAGVKDKSKMVMSADPIAHAKRVMEMRRVARAEKAAKSVSAVGAEVNKLASKVTSLEAIVSKGKKVADKDVLDLTEQLMNQLLKLDGIGVGVDEDVKLQKGKQVRRVQKYVETLDVLKIKNAKIVTTMPPQQRRQQQPQQPQSSAVVTTDWEVFDSLSVPSTSSAASTTTTSSTNSSTTPTPRFDWELF